jgi:PIN domain nuclease of toxin-antitoxin system
LAIKTGFSLINLNPDEAITFNNLPIKEKHRDPFDRMLIWQAIIRKMILISKDPFFKQYRKDGLKILW